MGEGSYTFNADGVITNPAPADASKDGIVAENGSLYYYENGVLTYAGLIQIDGGFYYVRTNGEVVHSRSYWITKTNTQITGYEEGSYVFGEDGRMVTGGGDVNKNGIVDGKYYENGVLTYAGLIEVGGKFYYVKTDGQLVMGQKYWVTKTNDTGVREGLYEFDANGVMKM